MGFFKHNSYSKIIHFHNNKMCTFTVLVYSKKSSILGSIMYYCQHQLGKYWTTHLHFIQLPASHAFYKINKGYKQKITINISSFDNQMLFSWLRFSFTNACKRLNGENFHLLVTKVGVCNQLVTNYLTIHINCKRTLKDQK